MHLHGWIDMQDRDSSQIHRRLLACDPRGLNRRWQPTGKEVVLSKLTSESPVVLLAAGRSTTAPYAGVLRLA